ncbi:MAG: hypothetical protein ACJA0Q_001950 [Saprospiraceae bacterium]
MVTSDHENLQYHHLDVTAESLNLSFLPDKIDGFAYCPGSINLKPFHRIVPEKFTEDYQLQVVGAIKVLQEILPKLKKQESASILLFSSVKYRFNKIYAKKDSIILLKIKGGGKTYQFRIKNKSSDRHSYIYHFETTKNWQIIKLNLSDMYPSCRGKRLDIPNFDNDSFEEISFFIGNKRNEKFELEINTIVIE